MLLDEWKIFNKVGLRHLINLIGLRHLISWTRLKHFMSLIFKLLLKGKDLRCNFGI
jgi:hypothetical protein